MPSPSPTRLRRPGRPRFAALALLGLVAACGPASEPAPSAAAPGVPLLLLISVDTLRTDTVGAFGSDLGLTPNLDALLRESVRFDAAYAAAPFTLPSVVALMTGRYPESFGIFRNESALPEGARTLATELRARGWRTAAVVGNFILRRSSGIAQGFDHFDDDFPQVEVVREWPERIAGDTTDAALDLLAGIAPTAADPAFVWVHYQDPHGPYTPPAELMAEELARTPAVPDADRVLPASEDHLGLGAIPDYQLLGDHREVGFYRAGYRAEIRYLDAAIGRLLRGLAERGLADDALIVFTADHGEGMGEDDYWFAHGEYLHEGQIRIPLAFRIPGRAPAVRDDTVAAVDLLPTLLALLGHELPDPAPGRDLFAPGAETGASQPYFATLGGSRRARVGLVDEDFKLVLSRRGEIWDGRLTPRGADAPDMTAAAPQVARRLRRKLLRIHGRIERPTETRQELSDQDRAGLRALGYVEEPAGP